MSSIRGGTDGSMLTARGLLTPNIYTGGQQFHSVLEWASVQDMALSAATIVELVKLWAEPDGPCADKARSDTVSGRQEGVPEMPHLFDDRHQRLALFRQRVLDAGRRSA